MKTTNNLLPTLSIFVLTALIFSTMSITTASSAKAKASKDFSQSYPGEGIEMTETETTNGAISVSGYDGSEKIVRAQFVVKGKNMLFVKNC